MGLIFTKKNENIELDNLFCCNNNVDELYCHTCDNLNLKIYKLTNDLEILNSVNELKDAKLRLLQNQLDLYEKYYKY
jgi:hypothetical protein